MTIRNIQPNEIEAARKLLLENGWGHRLHDAEKFRIVVESSYYAIVAIEGEEVIGFLRAISDGLYNAYISMVVVAAHHQRKGVGTALLKHLMENREDMSFVLRAGRGGVDSFYEKLGFVKSEVAMERTRCSD